MIFFILSITTVEHNFSTDDNVEEMETYLAESIFELEYLICIHQFI